MKKIAIIVLTAIALTFSNQAKASHMAGMDISYECISGNDVFRVQVAFYRDCNGVCRPGTMPINFSSVSCGISFSTTAVLTSGTEIIPYCPASLPTECSDPCPGGFPFDPPSREQYIYVDTVTLPATCTDWVISTTSCCRNAAINTIKLPGSQDLYVEATLNNSVVPCNSSPFFTNPPAPFIYSGVTFCYNNGAVDLNGDSLAYYLIYPKTGPGPADTVDYNEAFGPWTKDQPISPFGTTTLDPATGDICMTPNTVGEVTVIGMLVEEYRFGTLIGSVMRDIQVNVIAGADLLPTTDGINGTGTYSDTIAEGCDYTFTTGTADADVAPVQCLDLVSNIGSTLMGADGATFTVANNGCPAFPRPTGTFNWTPSGGTASNTPYVFVTRLRDDACPVNGEEYKAWSLKVIKFSAMFTSSAPACVNQLVNFYSQNSYSGYDYLWDFGADAIATYAQTISRNPVGVSYASSGAKTITLTISNPTGCSTSEPNIITINPTTSAGFTSTAPACAGEAVDFSADSTGPGITHSWDFGAGSSPSTSTSPNPVGIEYLSGGSKIVTHTLTNQFGCTSSGTATIVINPTPTASFTSTAPACTGDNVDFSNTGTTGATYAWDFDLAGTSATPGTSTSENPTGIVYDTSGSGIKYVRLITTLGLCVDTAVQTINLTDRPIPSFTHNAPQCEGDAVTFAYTGSTGLGWTYDWDFGMGATPSGSTSPNPPGVIYSGSGTKTVMVTATNGLCSDSAIQTIPISQDPVASFTSTAPACTGDNVDFSNTGTTGATYAWDFDLAGASATPGTSILENPTGIVYDTSGSDIKYVRLITTLGLCVDTAVQTINLTDRPIPSFTHNAPQCEGDAVTFAYTGSTGLGWTYNWDFGLGATPSGSTSPNPPGVIYSGSGTKTVMVTATNGLCSDSAIQTIPISQDPVASFTSTAPACTGDNVDFSNTGTTGATYAWDFDLAGASATPGTSTSENPAGIIYDTSGSGIKYVRLVTTLGLCVDTAVQTINLTDRPIPSFTHNAPQCEGDAVTFAYTGSTGLGWTYDWDFGLGATPSGSTSPNPPGVIYSGSGTKTVMITATNGTCSDSALQTIPISQDPVALFTSTAMTTPACTGNGVDFENTGTTGATFYDWTFGSGASPATSVAENPTGVIYSTAGIKSVKLITTLGGCVDSIIQTININQTPSVSFSSNTPVCAGEGVDFTNTGNTGGDWTYFWDLGAGAIPGTSTAENPVGIVYSYGGPKLVTFTITDGICLNTSTGTVVINNLPVADAGKDTTICADQSVQIGSAQLAGHTYSWFPPSTLNNPAIANPIASPIASYTTYIVTVTETSTGCVNTDSVLVTMVNSALVNAGPDVEICFGDTVQIGSALIEGQTYSWIPASWLDNPTFSNPNANPESTTLYTVSAMYEDCPPITDDVLVTVHPLPDAKATDSQGSDTSYITLGSSVQLVATGGIQYEWTPATDLDFADIFNPVASPDSSTNYTVTVTDVFGCVNRDTVRVVVDSLNFFIPTAFTPDGNGVSDVFFVRIAEVVDFELLIFDRWGEQLFISRNVLNGWDGKKQGDGKEMPQGAYVYSFKGTTTDGKEFTENGIVNLIR